MNLFLTAKWDPTGASYHHIRGGSEVLSDWAHFVQLVSHYSSRRITLESDVLNAFRGAMHSFRHSRRSAYNISGLPFFTQDSDPVGQSLAHVVFTALSWYLRLGRRAP